LNCGGSRGGEIVNRRAPTISKGLTISELGREAIWMKVGTKVGSFQLIYSEVLAQKLVRKKISVFFTF